MGDLSLRYHLSTRSVSHSALARGNEKLNADFFQEVFGLLYTRLQLGGSVPGKRPGCFTGSGPVAALLAGGGTLVGEPGETVEAFDRRAELANRRLERR